MLERYKIYLFHKTSISEYLDLKHKLIFIIRRIIYDTEISRSLTFNLCVTVFLNLLDAKHFF